MNVIGHASGSKTALTQRLRQGSDSRSTHQGGSSPTSTALANTSADLGGDVATEPVPPVPDDNENHDPTSILHSEYAHKRRELLEIVHDLRALGCVHSVLRHCDALLLTQCEKI